MSTLAKGLENAKLNPVYFSRLLSQYQHGRSSYLAALVAIGVSLLLCVTVTTCNFQKSPPPSVFVSIPPQAFFVEQIAGSLVEVNVLVGSGQSPATYDPTPQQMARLADASFLFTVGVPFEQRLLEKIRSGFKDLKVINTSQGIKLHSISHNHHDLESAAPSDPHIWLDPSLVKIQSETICKALCRLLPEQQEKFENNLAIFHQRLDSIAVVVSEKLAALEQRTIYVFHPSYGYFCDAFDLKQVAIEKDGKEPSARQLALIVEHCHKDSINVIFVQPQFSHKMAETIAKAIGGNVVPLDPLSRDYLNNLTDMAAKISAALGGQEVKTIRTKTQSDKM
ncbi:MAG: cation ABC transporter substrate-binding protein [Candidatus Zixiibacteriota bacterium]|nr:MAG: cation ABC transporter substrate-binding protein [candidate division Zixibacteria bacterium]